MFAKWYRKQYKSQPPALWVIVAITFSMWLGLGAIMPIRTIYAEREGSSLTEIGLMGSIFLLSQFLFQIPLGRFTDKYGRRPFILFAVIIHTLLSLAYLFLDSALLFIVIRAFEGIGTAAFSPAARAYISDITPKNKRGEAFGLFGAAVSGGILLGPAAGGFIGGTFGFTMPFIFCAVAGLLGTLLAIFKLPESIHTQVENNPDEVMVGEKIGNKKSSVNLFGLYFLAAYIIMFALQFVMSLLGTIWNIWLNDQGDSLNQIGLTYTVFGLPSLIFTPIFGKMIDRNHHRAFLYLLGGLGISIVYIAYGLASGQFGLIIGLSLLESLAVALIQPVTDRYTSEIIPANSRGAGQALFSTFSTIGGFVGAMLTTYAYQFWTGAPFMLAAAVQLTSTIIGSIIMWKYELNRRVVTTSKNEVFVEAEAEMITY